ncbi:endonuclease NucS [Candidatus Bathyarchaeota archaeon]|nr:endonuclease NucS [Candidatus Bathyarchaeota archaeon]MBS7630321.1 endonuclease NucS [Candidatus Bathyarchaeota archaeon]
MDKRDKIVLSNPSLDEAYIAIKSGISKRLNLVIIGKCVVDYEGRASSKLEAGERIVLLKSDGSIQIHRPKESMPVNWQPPGALFKTKLEKDRLHIRAYRKTKREVLEVEFIYILVVILIDLTDDAEFNLYASEEDMKRAILYEPSLLEEGFKPLTSEKKVKSGFIDIVGFDKNNVLTVAEIKKDMVNRDAILQLKRYIDSFNLAEKGKIRGILIAPRLGKDSQRLLSTLGFEFKRLSPQICAEILKKKRRKLMTEFLI